MFNKFKSLIDDAAKKVSQFKDDEPDKSTKIGSAQTPPTQNYSQMTATPPTPPPMQETCPVANNSASKPTPINQQEDSEGLYSSKIEKLIDMALADGELTEKEKQILFKKAEAEGIDLDEFEMVLDARLFEKNKQTALLKEQREMELAKAQAAAAPAAPKSNKYGDVRKCPGCGAIVPQFAVKCPECDFEFAGVEGNSSKEKLMKMLIDAEKTTTVIGDAVSFLTSGGASKATLQKKTIIANFPVPTTKEDIMEFIISFVPNAKKPSIFSQDPEARFLYPAWKNKLEELFIKAKITMKNDKDMMELVDKYAKELKIKI